MDFKSGTWDLTKKRRDFTCHNWGFEQQEMGGLYSLSRKCNFDGEDDHEPKRIRVTLF